MQYWHKFSLRHLIEHLVGGLYILEFLVKMGCCTNVDSTYPSNLTHSTCGVQGKRRKEYEIALFGIKSSIHEPGWTTPSMHRCVIVSSIDFMEIPIGWSLLTQILDDHLQHTIRTEVSNRIGSGGYELQKKSEKGGFELGLDKLYYRSEDVAEYVYEEEKCSVELERRRICS